MSLHRRLAGFALALMGLGFVVESFWLHHQNALALPGYWSAPLWDRDPLTGSISATASWPPFLLALQALWLGGLFLAWAIVVFGSAPKSRSER